MFRGMLRDVVSAGSLGLLGDVVCQVAIDGRKVEELETRRLAALTLFNSVYIGGVLHVFYRAFPRIVVFAGRWMPALRDKSTAAHAAGCSLVDNAHNGLIYIPTYYLALGVLENDSLEKGRSTLLREWWTTYSSCTLFWFPFSCMNFSRAVPPEGRVRVMAMGNLAWNVFVDWLAHRSRT